MSGFDEPERAPRVLSAVTIVLTAAAGALNVVTFFSFNQVFASTMSGNLILAGLRVGQGELSRALDNALAIAGYVSGLVMGTLLCGLVMRRLPWRNAVGSALTLELAILLATGALLFGVEEGSAIDDWSLVILVVGSGAAMGVQSAATRYIGPSGTPTSFLSGTVTNWVSGLVDLHRPQRRDWNSPLRLIAVVVAAAANAVLQRRQPEWSYAMPVALVAVAIALMFFVVRVDHGGPFAGGPQHAAPREAEPAVPGATR